MTYNDPGVVNTAYLLPQYGILQGVGFSNQAIAFGNYTVNAAGNDDNLFIYGDTGVQAYVATPTQARMPVGSQVLLGNNFKRVYAYGMGGNDTATYSGSALDETMTALAFYTFVNPSAPCSISTASRHSRSPATAARHCGDVRYQRRRLLPPPATRVSATRVPACSTTSPTATTESMRSTTSAVSIRPRSTAVR